MGSAIETTDKRCDANVFFLIPNLAILHMIRIYKTPCPELLKVLKRKLMFYSLFIINCNLEQRALEACLFDDKLKLLIIPIHASKT